MLLPHRPRHPAQPGPGSAAAPSAGPALHGAPCSSGPQRYSPTALWWLGTAMPGLRPPWDCCRSHLLTSPHLAPLHQEPRDVPEVCRAAGCFSCSCCAGSRWRHQPWCWGGTSLLTQAGWSNESLLASGVAEMTENIFRDTPLLSIPEASRRQLLPFLPVAGGCRGLVAIVQQSFPPPG